MYDALDAVESLLVSERRTERALGSPVGKSEPAKELDISVYEAMQMYGGPDEELLEAADPDHPTKGAEKGDRKRSRQEAEGSPNTSRSTHAKDGAEEGELDISIYEATQLYPGNNEVDATQMYEALLEEDDELEEPKKAETKDVGKQSEHKSDATSASDSKETDSTAVEPDPKVSVGDSKEIVEETKQEDGKMDVSRDVDTTAVDSDETTEGSDEELEVKSEGRGYFEPLEEEQHQGAENSKKSKEEPQSENQGQVNSNTENKAPNNETKETAVEDPPALVTIAKTEAQENKGSGRAQGLESSWHRKRKPGTKPEDEEEGDKPTNSAKKGTKELVKQEVAQTELEDVEEVVPDSQGEDKQGESESVPEISGSVEASNHAEDNDDDDDENREAKSEIENGRKENEKTSEEEEEDSAKRKGKGSGRGRGRGRGKATKNQSDESAAAKKKQSAGRGRGTKRKRAAKGAEVKDEGDEGDEEEADKATVKTKKAKGKGKEKEKETKRKNASGERSGRKGKGKEKVEEEEVEEEENTEDSAPRGKSKAKKGSQSSQTSMYAKLRYTASDSFHSVKKEGSRRPRVMFTGTLRKLSCVQSTNTMMQAL